MHYASGSLQTTIFSCVTFTRISCLHFGQYKGKLTNVVSLYTLVRVFPLHTGHRIHSGPLLAVCTLFPSSNHSASMCLALITIVWDLNLTYSFVLISGHGKGLPLHYCSSLVSDAPKFWHCAGFCSGRTG